MLSPTAERQPPLRQRSLEGQWARSVHAQLFLWLLLLFLRVFIFREGKGEREGEKHQCVVASCMPPTGDLACNQGMCPDWELNWRPLVSRPALNPLSRCTVLTPYPILSLHQHLNLKITATEIYQWVELWVVNRVWLLHWKMLRKHFFRRSHFIFKCSENTLDCNLPQGSIQVY